MHPARTRHNTIGGRLCCDLGSWRIGAAAAISLYPFKDRQWFESVFLGKTIQTPRTTRTPCLQDPTALMSPGTSKGFPVMLQDFLSFVFRKRLVQFSLT